MRDNIDLKTVKNFGEEWGRFDQTSVKGGELGEIFNRYFKVFPKEFLHSGATGFDLGCGSGRWSRFIAPVVKSLHCIDASGKALDVAKKNLSEFSNCVFHHAGVDQIPLEDDSMDFGFSLGVLHHIPDTEAGIRACVKKLKPGSPFLIYLYYSFDNRPFWYGWVWRISELGRSVISRMPRPARFLITGAIAALVYFPFAQISVILEKFGVSVENIPLSYYRNQSFYTMKTDALDRFGTPLERRFSKLEIRSMMEASGLEKIRFNEEPPFWCAVGFKR